MLPYRVRDKFGSKYYRAYLRFIYDGIKVLNEGF